MWIFSKLDGYQKTQEHHIALNSIVPLSLTEIRKNKPSWKVDCIRSLSVIWQENRVSETGSPSLRSDLGSKRNFEMWKTSRSHRRREEQGRMCWFSSQSLLCWAPTFQSQGQRIYIVITLSISMPLQRVLHLQAKRVFRSSAVICRICPSLILLLWQTP